MWSTATEAVEQLGAADHNTGACSKNLRPSPFFFSFSVECVSWYWSVGLKKKKLEKKSQEVSEQEALVPQDDVKR